MNTNTKPGERPQILGPTELVQALREKHAGGWRLSYRAAMRVVQEQYDFRRAAALSSPHPEALEGVIDALDFASQIETALANGAWKHTERANRIEMYVESRLAAQKDEGQAFTVEQVGWLRVVLGRALYRVEHFPEQSNDEDIEADELARAIILLGGDPAAPEPRPAEEPDHIPDVTQMVDTEPRPAEEPANLCEGCGLWPCGHHSPIGVRGCITTECANRKPTTGQLVADLRSQLARKDEGMRESLEEAAQSLEALAGLAGKDETMLEYDQVRGYALNRAMPARAALREPDRRKGE